jgi:hypothetical protein
VMTCRLNQWETAAGGNILTNSFDVYRTLDYSYQTSQGEDQVKEFISKWFADTEKVATQIRTELDAPGKERIKDLVKNPLRLTLLCASWEKDNQALPETQAGLYEKFVDYLYDWKAVEFDKEVELREELDLALGKLAKEGLNRQPINGAVKRFRFTTSEIRGIWGKQSKELLAAAKNLGWLNVVEKDTYAFYHPTFQEYFAACSIKHWDYFLPEKHVDRPVPCQGEDVPTYRVFERQWQQVVILWMGRRYEDISDKQKEEFINKLTDFREQEGDFYYYRAYCMAAICVGEFKSSSQAQTIIQNLVTWGLGDVLEKESTLNHIMSFARKVLILTHSQSPINILVELFQQDVLSSEHNGRLFKIARVLKEIAIGNQFAINSLADILRKGDLIDHYYYSSVADVLETIAIGNQSAINNLFYILQRGDLNEENLLCIVAILGKIDAGNKFAIYFLSQQILAANSLDDWRSNTAVEVLEEIASDNQSVITILTNILLKVVWKDLIYQEECYFCIDVAQSLGSISSNNQFAINFLVKILTLDNLSDLDLFYIPILNALEKIAVNNEFAINSLIQLWRSIDLWWKSEDRLLNSDDLRKSDYPLYDSAGLIREYSVLCDIYFPVHIVKALGYIAINHESAIDMLAEIPKRDDLNELLHHLAEVALVNINPSNQFTINSLVKRLQNKVKHGASRELLKQIINKQRMCSVISELKSHVSGEVYQSDIGQFKSCHDVLFHCAQTLSYPEFHTAWHQTHLPTTHSHPKTSNNN